MPLPEDYMLGLNEVIVDLDGDPHPEGLTFYQAMKAALTNLVHGEETMKGDERFDLYMIASKLKAIADRKPDAEELSVDELAAIKERVGKAFHPSIMGPVWLLIDPVLKGRKPSGKKGKR